jgi:hypothetical protein
VTAKLRYLTFLPYLAIYIGLHFVSLFLTHVVWKFREGGEVNGILCTEMRQETLHQWTEKKASILRKLTASFGCYRNYGRAYICCEILNICIVLGNLIAIETYLQAPQYGLRAAGIIPTDGNLSFDKIMWPAIARCEMPFSHPGANIRNESIVFNNVEGVTV